MSIYILKWKYWRAVLYKHPGIIGAFCCLLLWFVVTQWQLVGRTLIASPLEVTHVVVDSLAGRLAREENVFIQASATIRRVLIGWSLSLLAGIIIGTILGLASTANRIIEPVVEFFRSIPPIMLFPLFLVAFNYNEEAYIVTIALGCIPLVVLTVAQGFQQVSSVRLEILEVFRVTKGVRLFAQIMEILPSCVLAARLAFSISIIVTVVSEMVFTPRDGMALGALAKQAEMAFHTPILIASILIIGLFGYAGNLGIRKIEERLGYSKINGILGGEHSTLNLPR
ncbi:MAG: hypothetical protein QOE33_3513 [Acidobacteriota bacterium]|nr:hypothetical protein [Acidobacteriota bacterium]